MVSLSATENTSYDSESDLDNALLAALPGDIVSVQTYRIRSDWSSTSSNGNADLGTR